MTDLRTNLETENLITWLEIEALKRGTDNQRERWSRNLLPDDELMHLAREEIFSGFGELKRWHNISAVLADEQIKHTATCNELDLVDITFSTEIADYLTNDEWEGYKRVERAVQEAARTHPWCLQAGCTFSTTTRAHMAKCNTCEKSRRFPSALVTVTWAGRMLSREYALTA